MKCVYLKFVEKIACICFDRTKNSWTTGTALSPIEWLIIVKLNVFELLTLMHKHPQIILSRGTQ